MWFIVLIITEGFFYDLQKAHKRTIGSFDVFLSHLKPFGKLVMGIKVK